MTLLYTAHVPAGEGPFPTVIAIHGWGASAHDLLGLAPYFLGGQALVLCPQGRVEVPIGPGMKGWGWFPLRGGIVPDVAEALAAAAELAAFVEEASRRYPVDPERRALVGFSQGGMMAYQLALSRPDLYSGLAALSAWLPPALTEAWPPTPAHEGMPVLVVHGTEDPLVPIERARESREALRPFNVALTYREFPMAHEIRPEALEVIVRWLGERALKP
ncbi:MAG TPA: alpha/beta hydrolase-fold protein [Thermoanaerobaculia bacterium]|nr:alpha/beta hydrolase-fold protein [Thermoanaerobaculia bacterium]